MAGPIRIAILANGAQARAEMVRTGEAGTVMGKTVSRAGKLIGGLFALDALEHAAAAIVTVGGSYVTTLNKIQAITRSSNAQISKAAGTLEGQASQYAKMGETSADAADGVLELTKSGLSLKQALAAVYPTAVLAKSGQLQVGDAATLVANTLNAYGLKAKDAVQITNEIANAADISSADVTDLAESFKYVSPLAAKSGISLGQTNAVLAELANSGVKASQAGTGLRKFLLSIQAPTGRAATALKLLGVNVYDAQGKMRPLPALLDDLQSGLGKLTQAQQNKALKDIFGLQGVVPASILIKGGTDALAKYTAGVDQAGGASRLANANSKGLAGTLSTVHAELVTGADALYRKYSPAVNDALVGALSKAQRELPGIIGKVKATYAEVEPTLTSLGSLAVDIGGDLSDLAHGPLGGQLVSALKAANSLVKTFSDFLGGVPDPLRKVGIEAGIAYLALGKLTGGFSRVQGVVGTQITALQKFRGEVITTQSVLKTASTGPVPTSFIGLQIPPSNTLAAKKYADQLQVVEKQSLNTRAALARLAPAAKQVAGVGGMLLLADSAQRSKGALSGLEDVAGGAALGFSMGGPWGALIGGAGGGLIAALGALSSNTHDANEEFATGKQPVADYASSLDSLTGKVTALTRQTIQQQLATSGALSAARSLGVSERTVVSAVLGHKNAISQVNDAIAKGTSLVISYSDSFGGQYAVQVKNQHQLKQMTASLADQGFTIDEVTRKQLDLAGQKALLSFISTQTNEWHAASAAKRQEILSAQNLASVYKAFPKKVATRIDATGVVPTIAGVARLAIKYNAVDKRHVKALISATGVDLSVKQVEKLIAKLQAADHTKVNLPNVKSGVQAGVNAADRVASQGGARIAKSVQSSANKARANLPQLSPSVSAAAGRAAGVASSGGQQVGGALKAGIIGGFRGTADALAAEASAAVSAAIAAAKARAKIHSPSRETDYIGRMLGAGLAQGLERTSGKNKSAAGKLVRDILKGIQEGSSGLSGVVSSITDYIDKHVNLKNQKAEKARQKSILKSLDDQIGKVKTLGKQEDALQSGNYLKYLSKASALYQQMTAAGVKNLDGAKQALADLKSQAADFQSSIQATFASFADITNLGANDAGTVTLSKLLNDLQAQARKAAQFAQLIQQLTAEGLNATSIEQLLAKGPDALATAQAIAAGGQAAIAQINALVAQITGPGSAGDTLATSMTKQFYAAGIQSAQGLVDGLEQKSKDLQKIAEKLADDIVDAIKKKLNMKSPSRVMADLGRLSGQGLVIGLKAQEIHVKRQGANLADSLTTGFKSRPPLTSYLDVAYAGSRAQRPPIQLTVQAPVGSDPVGIGKTVVKHLDAYFDAGGRRSTSWSNR